MPIYGIDGVYLPVGGERVSTAGAVTPVAVTYPTHGFTEDDPDGFAGSAHVYYKLTASTSAVVTFDALLSFDPDGAPASPGLTVKVSTVGASPSGWSDLADPPDSISVDGRLAVPLIAGLTYVIGLFTADVSMVLRISGYGEITDWTQPEDQSWWNGADWQGQNLPPAPASTVVWSGANVGFHGQYDLIQALLGDSPAEDPSAADCLWSKVTLGNYGFRFWTDDGSGEGSAPGACVAPDVDLDASDSPGANVGAQYGGSPGSIGVGATANMDAYGAVSRFWVTPAVAALGPTGGLEPPELPDGGITVEYEAEEPELLGVDAAPDEDGHDSSDIEVDWFGTSVGTVENDLGTWGPRKGFIGGGIHDDWVSGGTGPLGLVATQDYELPPFPSTGADVGWTEVPSDVLAEALANEAVWQELEDLGTDLDHISMFAGGLRWVGLFPEMLTPTIPPGATPDFSPPETQTDVRHNQFVAVRLRVRPPRYRFTLVPDLPDAVPLETSISGAVGPDRTRFVGRHRS